MGTICCCFEDDTVYIESRNSRSQRNNSRQNSSRNNPEIRQPRCNRNSRYIYNRNQQRNVVSNQPRRQVENQPSQIAFSNQQRNLPSQSRPSNSQQRSVPVHTFRRSHNRHPQIQNADCVIDTQNECGRSITTQPKLNLKETLCFKVLAVDHQFYKYSDRGSLVDFSSSSEEYKEIVKLFRKTTQKHFEIVKIQKVSNPYLRSSYLLRQKEYSLLYGKDKIKEEKLFYQTEPSKINKIISENLNWREGEHNNHIRGKGVSFTSLSNFASNHSKGEKFMFVFTVLICNTTIGPNKMDFPPIYKLDNFPKIYYDTIVKPSDSPEWYIKFRDDEFYPSYLITFTGSTIQMYSQAQNDS